MEDGKSDNSANKLEVVEMFWVDTGMRVYLQGIIIMRRVLEQAVKRVEHFVREKEEEFAKGNVSGRRTRARDIGLTERDHRSRDRLHHRI